jgi:hypothetical protein
MILCYLSIKFVLSHRYLLWAEVISFFHYFYGVVILKEFYVLVTLERLNNFVEMKMSQPSHGPNVADGTDGIGKWCLELSFDSFASSIVCAGSIL